VKATPVVTVGLIVGVFNSGSLDWSLGLVNVDGWVWRQGAKQEQVRQSTPKTLILFLLLMRDMMMLFDKGMYILWHDR
jgi:hypothetical protein